MVQASLFQPPGTWGRGLPKQSATQLTSRGEVPEEEILVMSPTGSSLSLATLGCADCFLSLPEPPNFSGLQSLPKLQ